MDNSAEPSITVAPSGWRSEPIPTVDDMLALFNTGRIGEIEFRNWLAEIYPSFVRARRHDIDDHLEEQGRRILAEEEERLKQEQEEKDSYPQQELVVDPEE
jgi:hypothetical protein